MNKIFLVLISQLVISVNVLAQIPCKGEACGGTVSRAPKFAIEKFDGVSIVQVSLKGNSYQSGQLTANEIRNGQFDLYEVTNGICAQKPSLHELIIVNGIMTVTTDYSNLGEDISNPSQDASEENFNDDAGNAPVDEDG